MNQKGLIAIAIVAILVIAGIGIFALGNGDEPNESDKLTDFNGQEVVPVDNLDNGIVAVGQDSFRWMTYFGLADKCVMVDQNDMSNFLGKSFMYNGRAQVDIDNAATSTPGDDARKFFTHTNCGITTEDVGTIIDLNPSLVVVPINFYTDYKNEMNSIEKTGINTLAIGEIYTFLTEKDFRMTDDLVKQIDIIAAATGEDTRGDELKSAFNDTVKTIQGYSSKIKEKRTGYVGCIAYNGVHDVATSMAFYLPMELAGVTNIISGSADYKGSGVKEYAPDKIINAIQDDTILFIDAAGYSNNSSNEAVGILKAFNGHDAHIIMPYVWTGLNYDSVFIDAFQILRCAYGDEVITEAQLLEEIDKVYEKFYGTSDSNRNIDNPNKKPVPLPEPGTSIFEDMNDMYLVGKKNPIYGEVIVSADGKLSLKP